jgi:peptidoglycan/LPS O-acetylase OafA/YrhL
MPLNIILLALTMVIHNNHSLTAVNHLSSFFIGIIIISNIYPANDVIFKFLNNKWLIKIGILSYSIYIWQQLFTMTRSEPTSANIPWYPLPLNVILLFVISYISYNYYEKSFLKLKDRFK